MKLTINGKVVKDKKTKMLVGIGLIPVFAVVFGIIFPIIFLVLLPLVIIASLFKK